MLRLKIQQELDCMESLDAIGKVNTSTLWVNSMVTMVKPNGTLRICIDPRDLTKPLDVNITQCKPLSKLLPEYPMPPSFPFWMPVWGTGK